MSEELDGTGVELSPEEAADKVRSVLDGDMSDVGKDGKRARRLLARSESVQRRSEDALKDVRTSPKWLVPLFCTLMIVGLAWAVVYYLTGGCPIPHIGAWNLAIAFALVMAGFLLTMWWR